MKAVLVGLGGQFAGYALARDLSLGQATLVTTYNDFGTAHGLGVGAIIRSVLARFPSAPPPTGGLGSRRVKLFYSRLAC